MIERRNNIVLEDSGHLGCDMCCAVGGFWRY